MINSHNYATGRTRFMRRNLTWEIRKAKSTGTTWRFLKKWLLACYYRAGTSSPRKLEKSWRVITTDNIAKLGTRIRMSRGHRWLESGGRECAVITENFARRRMLWWCCGGGGRPRWNFNRFNFASLSSPPLLRLLRLLCVRGNFDKYQGKKLGIICWAVGTTVGARATIGRRGKLICVY